MNKKDINFIPITVMPLKKDKSKSAQCMELIDPIVKTDIIVTLNKYLDTVELKQLFHNIDER